MGHHCVNNVAQEADLSFQGTPQNGQGAEIWCRLKMPRKNGPRFACAHVTGARFLHFSATRVSRWQRLTHERRALLVPDLL